MRSNLIGYCSECGSEVYIKQHKQVWTCSHRGPASISSVKKKSKYSFSDEENTMRISIVNLSETALDGTLKKYSRALNGDRVGWTRCGICEDVRTISEDGPYWSVKVTNDCRDLCPLFPSKWCTGQALVSRLSPILLSSVNCEKYLQWVSIELELMRAGYEKHWGGAW